MILNIGSINIDNVYEVDHFLRPGETLGSESYNIYAGGKGSNQSIALAKAGSEVMHAGRIFKNDLWVRDYLLKNCVDCQFVDLVDEPGGHAIIQIDRRGENCILLYGGANLGFTSSDINRYLEGLTSDDMVLLQNEINNIELIINQSYSKGIPVAFNPAPMDDSVKKLPLEKVEVLIVNQVEGEQLSGKHEPVDIINHLRGSYPATKIILTLGADGVIYADHECFIRKQAVKVRAVDSTAAGDTFIGFFFKNILPAPGLRSLLRQRFWLPQSV